METISILEVIKESVLNSWENILAHLPRVFAAVILFTIGWYIIKYFSLFFKKTIGSRMKNSLISNFLLKSIRTVLVIFLLIFVINIAGFESISTALFTAAGASALIFGFAFKDIGENFISGVILSFNRPFDVNDTVSIGDVFGKVKSIEIRFTKIKTFDGKDVYIPNSDVIKKVVYNFTEDGYIRLDFLVGIAYEENIQEAEKVILAAVREVDGVVENDNHEIFSSVDELAVSTVNLKIYFWVRTYEYRKQAHQIKSDVVSNVKKALVEKAINMPADIKEIKLYGSQAEIPVKIMKQK